MPWGCTKSISRNQNRVKALIENIAAHHVLGNIQLGLDPSFTYQFRQFVRVFRTQQLVCRSHDYASRRCPRIDRLDASAPWRIRRILTDQKRVDCAAHDHLEQWRIDYDQLRIQDGMYLVTTCRHQPFHSWCLASRSPVSITTMKTRQSTQVRPISSSNGRPTHAGAQSK